MSKHTPGPWHIWKEDIGRERTQRISGKDGFCLALAYGETEDETSSNARLIAAAPEMYEALKGAVELLYMANGFTSTDLFDKLPVIPDMINSINALITKIDGKAP